MLNFHGVPAPTSPFTKEEAENYIHLPYMAEFYQRAFHQRASFNEPSWVWFDPAIQSWVVTGFEPTREEQFICGCWKFHVAPDWQIEFREF